MDRSPGGSPSASENLPPGTDVTATHGPQPAATVADLLANLDAMQSAGEEDGFVTVARADGVFLQMRRLTLERGDGSGPVVQGSMPPGMRALFTDFAMQRDGWDDGIQWKEPAKGRGLDRALPWWLPLVVVGVICAAVGWGFANAMSRAR